MISHRGSLLITLLLLPLAVPRSLSASVATHSRRTEATLQVSNHTAHQVNVRLVGGEGWYVLGRVHGNDMRVFQLRRALIGMRGIRVSADPLNQFTGFRSKPLATRTGEELRLVVTRPATASRLSRA